MVDLERDKGNISLPPSLQSPEPKDETIMRKNEPLIINMQTAFYDLKINEIYKRIRRLQERNDELIYDHEGTALLLTTTDVETAEEIAQLTRELFSEVSTLEELKIKLTNLEKAIVDDKLAHIETVYSINEKYAKKRLELVSELKPINAKINMLEDYRKSQDILQKKLEDTDDFMLKEEEKVNKQINQINLKFKVDREKLKKDMYNRLLDLAGTFQIEISDCIQEPVHKLIRENIMLNTYLKQIVNDSLPKKKMFTDSENTKRMLLKKNKSNYLDTKYNIKIAKINNHLLKSLNEAHKDGKARLLGLEHLNIHEEQNYSIERDCVQAKTNNSEIHMRELEVMLYRERIKLSIAKYIQNRIQCKLQKCVETIYDIKYAAMCVLQMKSSDPYLEKMDDKSLFLYLLEIILEGQTCMSNIIAKSTESIPQSSNVYALGDLGFEPVPIELKKSTKKEGFTFITPELLSIRGLEEQSEKLLAEDTSSTTLKTSVIQDLMEAKYSDIEESISEELGGSEITTNENSTDIVED